MAELRNAAAAVAVRGTSHSCDLPKFLFSLLTAQKAPPVG